VKLGTADVLIAATAAAHGLPLVTRGRDFARVGMDDVIV
jgi:predicted nucleic acid-binding protein